VLYKPTEANEHVFRIAKVIDVGPGKWNKKRTGRLPMDAKVGMRVLFIKFVATHTEQAKQVQREVLGKDFALIKDNDILADVGDLELSQLAQ
jgi:co-chaperonin GroES (HSP10)